LGGKEKGYFETAYLLFYFKIILKDGKKFEILK